jgi:hypothetical protein
MKTFMSDSSLGWMHGSDGDAGTVQNINAGIVNHQPMIASLVITAGKVFVMERP